MIRRTAKILCVAFALAFASLAHAREGGPSLRAFRSRQGRGGPRSRPRAAPTRAALPGSNVFRSPRRARKSPSIGSPNLFH